MKHVFLIAAVLGASALAQANEQRITGKAAAELYESLNLPATNVRDEHGGPDFAVAKYGKTIGCQKDLISSEVECWFLQ